jgi:4a-hydroxytetrahydrobiopterin dehydratase
MAAPRLTADEISAALADLPGWVLVADALYARHDAPDVPTATAILTEVFEAAEDMNHHPDADIRWKRLRWRLTTHESGGVSGDDVELAHRISAIATARGAGQMPAAPAVVSIGIDTDDPARIMPFWAAVLGYREVTVMLHDGEAPLLHDPEDAGPSVWFQQTDSPAAGRNRVHVDVLVTAAEAEIRRAAVEAAGGRLVTDEFAPDWWVYADADGNEACICV